MNEGFETKILTREQAEREILFIRDQVAAFGANDSELFEINEILELLRVGKILPEAALEKVRMISSVKNDRH